MSANSSVFYTATFMAEFGIVPPSVKTIRFA
jgi:hypothetical protein